MTLEQLVHTVEARLRNLGRLFCRPDPRARLCEQVEEAARELSQTQGRLSRYRDELSALERRVAENLPASVLLPSQIESCLRRRDTKKAWEHALELERVRQALVEDKERQPRLEQACWSLRFQLRQIERRLARLQEQLYPGSS
jgi:chromosome segregation ATPase